MSTAPLRIYHNPRCSKSRSAIKSEAIAWN